MQSTSPVFNPYSSERYVDFSIRFELLDENAKGNAVPAVSGQESISQLDQLTDAVENRSTKLATLEPDLWALDGTFEIMPDDVSEIQTGWWNDVLSGEDGGFDVPPSLSFVFGGLAISTIGFMLYFDRTNDSFPTLIKVMTYRNSALVEQKTFNNDRRDCVIDMPVQDYDSVTFEFLETSKPYRRIKLLECLFGIVQEFNKENLVSANLLYSASITAETFPSRQLDFVFENLDRKYNLINPNGLYAYLQQGQDIHAKVIINGESVDMGVFEFSSAEASDDEITGKITANDVALSKLEGGFNGGSNTQVTLQNAVDTVLSGLGIETSIEYPNLTVLMAMPQGTTKREAIRCLAQAAKCSVWLDRDGVLQIHPLVVGAVNDTLDADNLTSLGGIRVSQPVDKVELTFSNEYAVQGDTTGLTEVFTSGAGDRVKTFTNYCFASPEAAQSVCDWLLAQCNRRVSYEKDNRGNPAIEIGDTLKIYDAYGENRNAVATEQSLSFDGGLFAKTKAVN